MENQDKQRTGNVTNEEYLADYPSAIVDVDKAKYVAEQVKTGEEEVNNMGKFVLGKIDDFEGLDKHGDRPSMSLDLSDRLSGNNVSKVLRKRENLNGQIEEAERVYDSKVSPVKMAMAGKLPESR